jgi:hypothetical protein
MVTVKVEKTRDPFTGEEITIYHVTGIPPMFAHLPAESCLKIAENEGSYQSIETLEMLSEREQGDKVWDIKRHHHTHERHAMLFRSPTVGPVEIRHSAWRTIT